MTLATPFARASSADAADRLGDYYVLPGDGTGSAALVELGGLRLKGGLFNDFDSGVRLFSDFTLPASGRLRYRLTREILPPTVTSNGVWLNVGIVWGNDPAALPATTYNGDTYTSTLWDGWRITHANKDLKEIASNRLRIRSYKPREQLPTREPKVLANFKPGVAYDVTLTWGGRIVTIVAMGKKQSWSNTQLRVPASGARLMWYGSFGGQWLIENIRLD
ncbi:MAG: hypothetical protein K0R61_3674 [Microvirga sp.]|nr:hypothetical protein [Microvirga sp.]